jgi:glycine betaine transporter
VQRDRSEVGVVFWVSAAFSVAFILWGVIAPESFATVTQAFFDRVVANLGWFYLLAGNFFLVFVVILALSRYGKLRLGKEDGGDRGDPARGRGLGRAAIGLRPDRTTVCVHHGHHVRGLLQAPLR